VELQIEAFVAIVPAVVLMALIVPHGDVFCRSTMSAFWQSAPLM
jgi:hypothetical protein